MSDLRFETGKNYRYLHNKQVYRLEWITPQVSALPATDIVLYLSRQGAPMMPMPLALAPRLLQLYEGPHEAGKGGGVDADDPLDA